MTDNPSVVYGLLPIVLAFGLCSGIKIAWTLTLLVDVVWICAEIAMFSSLGFFFFYPLIAGFGAITVLLSLLPSTRGFVGLRYAQDSFEERDVPAV